jgi:3-oxoacyl-[acyl-carrier-protein] synthase II
MQPEDIDYINAHATSTPLGAFSLFVRSSERLCLGDEIENRAIKRLFGKHAHDLAVSSSKGAIGHLLGAAGAVESIFTILAVANVRHIIFPDDFSLIANCNNTDKLLQDEVPPTVNFVDAKDPELNLNYVPARSQRRSVRAAINNSFGFGGTNASLLFKKPDPALAKSLNANKM